MKIRRFRFLTLLSLAWALLLLTVACSIAGSPVTEEDKEQAINVLKWNLYYAQAEDLAGYMRTIHDDSPGRAETLSAMQLAFKEFNLSYSLVNYQILSITQDTADIRVIMDTRKIAGDLPFNDNRVTAVHTLKKTAEGKWKIYSSDFEDVQFIN